MKPATPAQRRAFARYYRKNRDRLKRAAKGWRIANPETAKKANAEWRKRNPDKVKAAAARSRAKHRLKRRKNDLAHYYKNRDRFITRQNAYMSRRRKADPAFRLSLVLRSKVSRLLSSTRCASTFDLTGCTAGFLRDYLTARLKTGMNWENYGVIWQIDHRIPCASFNLSDPEQQRLCFHYSNLQPMLKSDNIRKGAKLPLTHQAEFL